MTTSEDLEFRGLSGHLARAEAGNDAAVLLVPFAFGLNQRVRDLAAELAGAGLTTLIWDPYPGQAPAADHKEVRARSAALKDSTVIAELTTCVDYLIEDLGARRVGTIGFCMGGRFNLMHAAVDHRLTAVVPYFPTLIRPLPPHLEVDAVEVAGSITAPVHLIYAGQDHLTKLDTFLDLQATLQERGAPTTIQVYPAAEHGFMDVDGHPEPHNADARAASWPQAVAFLTSQLLTTQPRPDQLAAGQPDRD
ncbi:dienelactone hydrolase family protein [Kribbella solani]|uniref:dienelactone hydrolase family protein n=1 Tax=Kribbella solani TaxID=236067 RepID=UPI0029ADB70B|nr:dienelactone hydrolase family protein [Kribbella solani]MDX2974413.1 dienelactone hydrolase family protein [Kribbella solani]MDX3005600.1 dienelactone hydrolase family protein [Kribbella solani]